MAVTKDILIIMVACRFGHTPRFEGLPLRMIN